MSQWRKLYADALAWARAAGYTDGRCGDPHRRVGWGRIQRAYDLAYGRGRMARIEEDT